MTSATLLDRFLNYTSNQTTLSSMAAEPSLAGPRPGLDAPLDYHHGNTCAVPRCSDEESSQDLPPPPYERFPSAVVMDDCWTCNTLSLRERALMAFINSVTDKPGWNVDVNDEEVVSAWRTESLALPAVPSGFSDAMFEFAMDELRDKAKVFEDSDGIISVLDSAAAVYKQDVLANDSVLLSALKAAARPLEDVPEGEQDWEPGSKQQVLNLVDPSLWPLVYGKSRVLRDRTIGVDEALGSIGAGEVIPTPTLNLGAAERMFVDAPEAGLFLSTKFQWLPAEIELHGDTVKVASYINNLHPVEHAALYTVVEWLIEKALPLWNTSFEAIMEWHDGDKDSSLTRLPYLQGLHECTVRDVCGDFDDCTPQNRPRQPEDASFDEEAEDTEWYAATHPPAQPEPDSYKYVGRDDFSFGPWFDEQNLQVIVKVFNVHLTPENPTYDGGPWHVEGLLNERICATALFYYDSENITDSHIAFRIKGDAEEMYESFELQPPGFNTFEAVYGVTCQSDSDTTIFEHGRVLAREGRLVAFPNVYQSRVEPFELVDKTKPGHQKVVALFLVDPATPVVSTANVPPQQEEWGVDAVSGRLPPEIAQIVRAEVSCPYGLGEAKRLRQQLLEERDAIGVHVEEANAYCKFLLHDQDA